MMSLIPWTIEDITAATAGDVVSTGNRTDFSGVGIDSRDVAGNDIFAAIVGPRHDGHDFFQQVLDAGVSCIVCCRDRLGSLPVEDWKRQGVACIAVDDTIRALGDMAAYQRRRAQISVVAVTGSNGKTSTKELIAAVLARKYKVLSTAGNLNNEIGMPLTLLRLETEHQAAVLELGMNHPGEIDRLAAICRPDVGVITNIAPAHLEGLGSVEGVAAAKAELLIHIRSGGTAVLNSDDAYGAWLASRAQSRVVFFGCTDFAGVRAGQVAVSDDAVTFELIFPEQRAWVKLPVPWRFMVKNALAAAAAGWVLGIDAEQIAAGLAEFRPVAGRMVVHHTPAGANIIDDTYNANPGSMENAIRSLAELGSGKQGILVAGDMLELGDDAARHHEEMGRMAADAGISRLYLSGDFAARVAHGARQGGMKGGDIFVGTKHDIVRDLARDLNEGDWVLIKGSRSTGMDEIVCDLTREPAPGSDSGE
ncbi:MAG: UDP-N-acetylmuramoyl-tripeptide--D-alanyl-D-alanine ligase [Desulfosalsimonas sp.]|uniref:UDP-N-acetylmuramoyl-tripeptide--D-alanyl-D- alanine ligase n=1 Tax=Desulfosalsimonas sp. TaxID=3073848 RepID=UPI003970AB2D